LEKLVLLSWALAAAVPTSAAEPTYKGYAVTATKAERRHDLSIYDKSWVGGGRTDLYAGEGHWIVVVTVKFEGEARDTSFVGEDGTASIPRSKVSLVDKTAKVSYSPSSWTGHSWNDWDKASEQIKFNKNRTKATTKYLFRVAEDFDREGAILKLGDQELPLSFR
jgi:hypothetical protein